MAKWDGSRERGSIGCKVCTAAGEPSTHEARVKPAEPTVMNALFWVLQNIEPKWTHEGNWVDVMNEVRNRQTTVGECPHKATVNAYGILERSYSRNATAFQELRRKSTLIGVHWAVRTPSEDCTTHDAWESGGHKHTEAQGNPGAHSHA